MGVIFDCQVKQLVDLQVLNLSIGPDLAEGCG